MKHNEEFSDLAGELWSWVELAVTNVKLRRTKLSVDDRKTFEGILWKLLNDQPWRSVPEKFGNWNTIFTLHRRLQVAGVWKSVLLRMAVDEFGGLRLFETPMLGTGPHLKRPPISVMWDDIGSKDTKIVAIMVLAMGVYNADQRAVNLAREIILGLGGEGRTTAVLIDVRVDLNRLQREIEDVYRIGMSEMGVSQPIPTETSKPKKAG